MEDGHCEFNMAKVTWTFLHVFTAGGAGIGAIDGAELGVVQAFLARALLLLVLTMISA